MTDLTEFLLAQVGKDEAAAREVAQSVMRGETPSRMGFPTHFQRYLSSQSPARTFAECDVKRRIVDQYERAVRAAADETDTEAGWVVDGVEEALLTTLKILALSYATEDDYRDEWRP